MSFYEDDVEGALVYCVRDEGHDGRHKAQNGVRWDQARDELRRVQRPITLEGHGELARAVQTLDRTSIVGRLAELRAEDLLCVVRACWASEWDVWPDSLSDRQIDEAITSGGKLAPRFRETSRGLEPIHTCVVCGDNDAATKLNGEPSRFDVCDPCRVELRDEDGGRI